MCAVQFRNRCRECQSQPCTHIGTASLKSIKTLEDVFALLDRNAWSVVTDIGDYRSVLFM